MFEKVPKLTNFDPHYRNSTSKLLDLWLTQNIRKSLSYPTPVKDILKNGYSLSANIYSQYGGKGEIDHRESKEILGEIEDKERKMRNVIEKKKNPQWWGFFLAMSVVGIGII